MKELRTEISINASRNDVWLALTSTAEYNQWNPFILYLKGELKVGEKLEVKIHPPGGSAMVFKPVCLEFTENVSFCWLGKISIKGIFDGEHIFELKEEGMQTLFIQREKFSGILVPFLWKSLNTKTRRGFELMNRALKNRVEGRL